MRRSEPPPAATWVLEHLTPANRDEAIAGDLLEVFRSGRSRAWYWRQVLWACGIAWMNAFRARLPLIVFAFLWSMLAPAWTLLFNRMEDDSQIFHVLLRLYWPLDELAHFAIWTVLNATFLWAGMFVYILSHSGFGRSFHGRQFGRAFLLAPTIFVPAYVAAFILMNLYAYPGFDAGRRNLAPLGEVVDLRPWALVVRVPYFLSLLCALWANAPRAATVSGIGSSDLAILPAQDLAEPPAREWPEADEDSLFTPRLVAAGCISAVGIVSLLCLISIDRLLSAVGVIAVAAFCLAEAVFAGATGAVLLGARSEHRSWTLFLGIALACGPAWVWLPAAVLLANRRSAWAMAAFAIAAGTLAVGLRRASRPEAGNATETAEEKELFAETLRPIPGDWHGFAIAASLYAAFLAVRTGRTVLACAFAAAAAFLFAWQRATPIPFRPRALAPSRSAARRLAGAALPAFFATIFALLVASGTLGGTSASAADSIDRQATDKSAAHQNDPHGAAAGLGFDGYQSIVLWPFPPKMEIVPPILTPNLTLPAHALKPIVIRFDGSYWYFQPPAMRPGAHPHVAHGTPLDINIHSTNSLPLMMEADQALAAPVRISRCREIQVAVANRDNRPGRIAIGMILTDSAAPGRPTLFLGRQPVLSTEPDRFTRKLVPVEETLRFALPAHPAIRRFDEITLIVYPDVSRVEVGARLAVEELQLKPR